MQATMWRLQQCIEGRKFKAPEKTKESSDAVAVAGLRASAGWIVQGKIIESGVLFW